MPRILFIASHRPDRSPAQRFRFEQYLSCLKENGIDYDFSYLITEADDKIFYAPGNLVNKLLVFFKSALRRFRDVINADKYDIIFVQREAFMTGSSFFEKRFAKSKARLVFDFDDAIWYHDVSDANKKFGWLKDPSKTGRIIGLSDLVFAGNQYLADYAARFNNKVIIVPTTIDTEEYKPVRNVKRSDKVVIGWSGSITTIRHFELALPFLKILKEKYGDKIDIRVIGDGNYKNAELGIQGLAWRKETELDELSSFDIGIMPIPDDDWSKGKCGLKGLQYMALEIATVMSPVGVNSEIIQNGVNGFLAATTEEWVNAISKLIDDQEMRNRFGKNARTTVIDKYSVASQKKVYLNSFQQLITNKKK
ncbi:MAG: glycosyltransferase family 4 protein [Bacteroidia bacterium]|jgi:glycosyltransferase involved in cell wall biosynthesis|nr:glycosyltransferase family 4 protein [Bacteroidia bacterium]